MRGEGFEMRDSRESRLATGGALTPERFSQVRSTSCEFDFPSSLT